MFTDKPSIWTLLTNVTDYLYEVYTTEIGGPCKGGGTITTMWEWGSNPNTISPDYTVDRVWTSGMGDAITLTLDTSVLPDFLGLDHYVDFPGPYALKSVYPPAQTVKWVAQNYIQLGTRCTPMYLNGSSC